MSMRTFTTNSISAYISLRFCSFGKKSYIPFYNLYLYSCMQIVEPFCHILLTKWSFNANRRISFKKMRPIGYFSTNTQYII